MKQVSLQFDPDNRIHQTRHDPAQQVQHLRNRAQLLEASERELIEIVFEQSGTFEQIARLTGQNASSINRRFRKLTQKLIAHEFLSAFERNKRFTTFELTIGREYFMHRRSQQQICQKYGCSRYRVRKVTEQIRRCLYEDAQLNQSK